MSAARRCFVDSNVWLYAFVAGQDEAKSRAAIELIRRETPAISVQVINEVCVNLIRKAAFDETAVRALIESFFAKYHVVPVDKQVLLVASELRQRYSLSYWDSTVTACALRAQADVLYSEVMQHGMIVEGSLSIVNPFAVR